MFDASRVLAPPRKRGPKALFVGKKLVELVTYLATEGSTIEKAAIKFKCSTSTIEKTLTRLRKAENNETRLPTTETGPSAISPEAEAPSAPSVAQGHEAPLIHRRSKRSA